MGDTKPVADEVTTPQDGENPLHEAVASGEGEPETPEDLHLALEDARNKADSHWNELLRAQAEQENLRKRAARDVGNARKYALEGFAKELLPVRDALELGLSAAREAEGSHPEVLEGMELTFKQLSAAMEKFHISEVNPEGQPFDPELHQAMATQPSDQHPHNTVLTVYQKGYLLNNRLIRPAMVVVSKA